MTVTFELAAYGFAALAAASLIAVRLPPFLAPATHWLEHRAVAVMVGLLSAALYWWLWGSLNAVPMVHDEAAYVLQAEIFARGRWAVPSPPLPQFFEQFHVFVTPVLSPKYPPGHAILLVPGVLLGFPGLVPVLLSGLTGGLLFALARRVSNGWIALLTWLLWMVAPINMLYRPTYFSEVTTGLLILVAWWALLDWRKCGSTRSMLVLSAVVGWGTLARPLTMLAFAIPIGVYVVWQARQRRSWRQVAAGVGLGLAIIALYPIQSAHVTGDWRLTPLRHYSEVYFPFDLPGFGATTQPSKRALPPDMVQFRESSFEMHETHTLAALPETLFRRARAFLQRTWGMWRGFLAPLALIGLIGLSVEVGFAVGSIVVVMLAYLVFAHPPGWSLYYLEGLPVVAFVTALGFWRTSQWVMLANQRERTISLAAAWSAGGVVVLALAVLGLPKSWTSVEQTRRAQQQNRVEQTNFRNMVSHIPGPAIVFVRYAPSHNIHTSLITNVVDLSAAQVWVVYDRGAENTELMSRAPSRTPYLFEEETGHIYPMDARTGDAIITSPESSEDRPPD